MSVNIIGFSGEKQSGKNTASNYFNKMFMADNSKKIPEFAFADSIKRIIHNTFDIEDTTADILKNSDESIFYQLTLREVYQRLAEEIKSVIRPTIWADLTLEKIDGMIKTLNINNIIITDLRYTLEEAVLRKYCEDNGFNLIIIKMLRLPSNEYQPKVDTHISEIQIKDIKSDYTISAKYNIEIKEKIKEIYNAIYSTKPIR